MTTLASEASAAGIPLATRAQFSAFYCTAVLSSPALSAAYSALELAAFARFCSPAAGRQGFKVDAEMQHAIIRARNHFGYSKSGAGRNTARAYTLYTLTPHTTPNHTRSVGPFTAAPRSCTRSLFPLPGDGPVAAVQRGHQRQQQQQRQRERQRQQRQRQRQQGRDRELRRLTPHSGGSTAHPLAHPLPGLVHSPPRGKEDAAFATASFLPFSAASGSQEACGAGAPTHTAVSRAPGRWGVPAADPAVFTHPAQSSRRWWRRH